MQILDRDLEVVQKLRLIKICKEGLIGHTIKKNVQDYFL